MNLGSSMHIPHCSTKWWLHQAPTWFNQPRCQCTVKVWSSALLELGAPRSLGYWRSRHKFLPSCVSPLVWPLELALVAPLALKSIAQFLSFQGCNFVFANTWGRFFSFAKAFPLRSKLPTPIPITYIWRMHKLKNGGVEGLDWLEILITCFQHLCTSASNFKQVGFNLSNL